MNTDSVIMTNDFYKYRILNEAKTDHLKGSEWIISYN
jgi:hypothetical protein